MTREVILQVSLALPTLHSKLNIVSGVECPEKFVADLRDFFSLEVVKAALKK